MKRERHYTFKLLINVNISRLVSYTICLYNDIKYIMNLKYIHIYIMKIEYAKNLYDIIIFSLNNKNKIK